MNECMLTSHQYRRAIEYPYETTYFTVDALNAIALHPKFLDVGG
jgi:hypothetical protein